MSVTRPDQSSQSPARSRLRELLGLLLPVLDIIHGNVDASRPPSWCQQRGWSSFLLSLSDAALDDAETHGLESTLGEQTAIPEDLRALLRAAREVTRLPWLDITASALPVAALRGVSERKREQLRLLLAALAPNAKRAARIVDVGAGGGHFSRLAAELFDKQTVALDRDALLLQNGAHRREQRERQVGKLDLRFVEADLTQQALELQSTDLAVGLHACGELGDRLVLAAAEARCELALVSCCLQKTSAPERSALSLTARDLRLSRAALGLTNLTPQAEGVEATLRENLRARELRLALRRLLQRRGLDLAVGEEMRGVNRRRAQGTLHELANLVFTQRGLAPASAAELESEAASAHRDYAQMRRLSLPRTLLGRAVELAIVLDRAAALEERGFSVQVVQWCQQRVTPRNTLLLARAV